MKHKSAFAVTLCIIALLWSVPLAQAQRQPPRPRRPLCPAGLPAPEIEITGTEDYVGGDGHPYTRYKIAVTNRAAYPDYLFAAAPDLPACGSNPNSSRTWVDIEDGGGTRLYGFCALSRAADLADLWFAEPKGTKPPKCVSVILNDRRCKKLYKSKCVSTRGPCIDFEGLPLGTTYPVGSAFTDSGATMSVKPFQWSNGNWTSSGHVRVSNGGLAGAAGQEITVNNVNVAFSLPVVPGVLSLSFGEYGGNLNIEVNGDFRNFLNFADIHGATIGGTHVAVTNGLGNDKGTLTLTGEVHSFAVGGQELVIDHLCAKSKPPVVVQGTWIMPFGVGGTRLDGIKPTGFTDYTDGLSGFAMINAPFGGHLGFRLGAANIIPTANLYYYRIQYRHELEAPATWHDFDETVTVHYQKERPAIPPTFPTLVLGPKDVGGKNLYRFRPHEAELPSLVPVAPGETVSWPASGFLGDIYAGYLSTAAPLNLTPGRYVIRMTIYDSAGVQVSPGAGTFQFVVPTGALADGTITTAFAAPASISAGGFEFNLHIDNRPTTALIDEPKIGGVGAGPCGFLRYDPAAPPLTPPVDVAFHATHPDGRALFTFKIVRAHTTVGPATISGAEVSAPAAGAVGVYGTAYVGDGNGNFSRTFSRGELLGPCLEAAFSQNLYVYAKATTGWSQRITSLDSSDVFAFALTPE